MGVIKSLFIEIIESITPDPNWLMWKFEDADKEIKNGAQLTVRESQQALFLNEGQLADVFQPGRHKLGTENTPILCRLKGWKYGFESPIKADVYFFNTHQFLNLQWGTPAPIILSDPKFGQVRIRAFGSYNIRIADVATFFRQYAGTFPRLTIFELNNQLRNFIAPKFGEVLVQHGYSITDVAGNITELSDKVLPQLQPFFAELGLELLKFQITSVTLPDEVSAHFDKVTNMNMVTDMDKFKEFSIATAIGQQGTAVNEGTQQGAMMAAILGTMNQQQAAQNKAAAGEDEVTRKLKKLKELFDAGLIDENEFKAKKADLLKEM
jgi:membrane protease subunit (stomatin/prohibitin family)